MKSRQNQSCWSLVVSYLPKWSMSQWLVALLATSALRVSATEQVSTDTDHHVYYPGVGMKERVNGYDVCAEIGTTNCVLTASPVGCTGDAKQEYDIVNHCGSAAIEARKTDRDQQFKTNTFVGERFCNRKLSTKSEVSDKIIDLSRTDCKIEVTTLFFKPKPLADTSRSNERHQEMRQPEEDVRNYGL